MPGPAVMPQPGASLVRAASAKSSLLPHARAADNHPHGPLFDVPAHSDWTDGRDTCGVWGHTADSVACHQFLQAATTGCAWLAKLASTRAPEA